MQLQEALDLGWTEEQYYESLRNHKKVTEQLKVPSGYVLHHRDPAWKREDPARYVKWNLEDLELMTKSEHTKLHNTGIKNPMYGRKHSEESKNKMRGTFSEEHKQKLRDAWMERRKKPISEETRKRMSQASKGKKHSENTKQKIRESKLGHVVSEECRNKISETKKLKAANMTEAERKEKFGANKGKTPANKGKPHSEETRRKMREAWLRRKMNQ